MNCKPCGVEATIFGGDVCDSFEGGFHLGIDNEFGAGSGVWMLTLGIGWLEIKWTW
jgi:hypothetical protein